MPAAEFRENCTVDTDVEFPLIIMCYEIFFL